MRKKSSKSKNLSRKVTQNEMVMEGIVGVPLHRIYDAFRNRVIVKIKGCDID